MAGRFITLEGGEGVGKSTQLAALAAALASRGIDVITTREPGGSVGAEAIRALLLAGTADAWSPQAEALLFAAARSDHVDRLIRPALAAGRWVICDRFIDSTRAYQGDGGGGTLADADIMALHGVGSSGLLPDRSFVFDIDPAIAAARRKLRDGDAGDRFEQRNADFHARVRSRFRDIAMAEPERVRLITVTGDPAVVTAQLLAALGDWL